MRVHNTVLLQATSDKKCQAAIAYATALLKAGELVAFPTDTVYGVGAIVSLPDAISQLYLAKQRPLEKAIPILAANLEQLTDLVREIEPPAKALIANLWPGALTLILPKSDTVPPQVSATPGVAVRIPALLLTRQIIEAAGRPLAVTSANRSGQASPRTAQEVIAQLGGRVSAVVDGGECTGGVPSTIVDCTSSPPRLVRRGAIPIDILLQYTSVVF